MPPVGRCGAGPGARWVRVRMPAPWVLRSQAGARVGRTGLRTPVPASWGACTFAKEFSASGKFAQLPAGSVLGEPALVSVGRAARLSGACYLVPGVRPLATKAAVVYRLEEPRCERPQEDQPLGFPLSPSVRGDRDSPTPSQAPVQVRAPAGQSQGPKEEVQ